MQALPLPDDDSDKARALKQAFAVFNKVSAELTQSYEQLQGKVASLTTELAVANGELRRQYEEKQALSDRLSSLLSALPAGVVVLDGGGQVAELNPAARLMLGEDVVGREWRATVGQRLEPTDTPDEWWLSPAAGQGARRRVNIAAQLLPSGGVRILLLHDVTGAHEMKASLDRSQRLAAMGEMAASLAHQLRTPLSAALLYSANLGKARLPDEARVRFADKTAEQLRRLERLIHDVLLFARGQDIGREVILASELLLEAANEVEPVFRQKSVRLVTRSEGVDPIIIGGRKSLGSALVSLLENALQASPIGSVVMMEATKEGNAARIAVRDAGPGIAPDLLDRVFEPFFTTRAQGTGLGLAIALGVLRAHGGRIEVASTLGSGAEFVLILPADAASS